VSGFDVTEFTFYGFLPREKKPLLAKLAGMKGSQAAIIHESPFRVVALMEAIKEALPNAMVSASCDLTKLHELTLRGTPGEVLTALRSNEKADKGEYCIVLDLRNEKAEEAPKVAELSPELCFFEELLRGVPVRQARDNVIARGYRKNDVYRASLEVMAKIRQLNGEDQSE